LEKPPPKKEKHVEEHKDDKTPVTGEKLVQKSEDKKTTPELKKVVP
jgi:hypothetical protein